MLWWCLVGLEWIVSFLPLHTWSRDMPSLLQCKLHCDGCLGIVLHTPPEALAAPSPFEARLAVTSLPMPRLPELALPSAVPCSFSPGRIQTSELPCQTALPPTKLSTCQPQPH